ncbi:polysaccharide export protein EpsE [Rubrivivax sp. RP6-9]|uniref:polysaccharide export protein EpsE n=1 Tax=Rubrivivax sp. RP6-9 TaxID=3415750 RepID=UPI003CC52209
MRPLLPSRRPARATARALLCGAVAAALAGHAAAQPAAPAQAVAVPAAEYRLGAGDVVRISVYQNPDLALETRVTEAGVVSYPLLGSIRLGGLSVTAAEQLIADGLRTGNFVKQPQVTLVVVQVRGNQASVLGQVNRPGRYPIEVTDLRLTDLLALAGGTANNGADRVVVTGTRNGQPMRLEVDLPALFGPGGSEQDLRIQHGDTVWVDRQPQVYIYGEVQRPGVLRLERGMTVMQALASGGGLTQRGTHKGLRVHRKAADGSVAVIEPTLDDRVQDGDVVFVRESLF